MPNVSGEIDIQQTGNTRSQVCSASRQVRQHARLFQHPLGIPIPHTAIIPRRKDEIGRTLGEFVETEFLRADVVRDKLESTPGPT